MAFANGDMLKAGLSWLKEKAGTLTLNTGVPVTYEEAMSTILASRTVTSDTFRGPVYVDPHAVLSNPLSAGDCALYIDLLELIAHIGGMVESLCIFKSTEPELLYSTQTERAVAVQKDYRIILQDVCILCPLPTETCELPDEYEA